MNSKKEIGQASRIVKENLPPRTGNQDAVVIAVVVVEPQRHTISFLLIGDGTATPGIGDCWSGGAFSPIRLSFSRR